MRSLARSIGTHRTRVMVEKIRAVRNPLTVIGIFAALAEIAPTTALKLVAPDSQGVFIWFVMLFPVFLVGCFFLTLNFNPKVLYAPSDFRREENFLNILAGSHQLTANLGSVDAGLADHQHEVGETLAAIDWKQEADRKHLWEALENHMQAVRAGIEQSRQTAQDLSSMLRMTSRTFRRTGDLLRQACGLPCSTRRSN